MNLKNYFKELKRRNVIKAALAYLIVAWLVIQVLSIILPAFEAPPYLLKSALIILFIGFPIWIVFSWIYEFTPEGLKKTIDVEPETSMMSKTGSRINKVIIFALSLAVVILVVERLVNKPVKVLEYGEKGIAVLAFADMSPNKDHEYFSDGISEELLNILVRIPKLKVISRTSSFSYKGKSKTAIEIGEELNVSHILEGSIRKSGNTIRITAQLINTADGSHEWSETYDRNLDSVFKIQDEIASAVSRQLELTLMGALGSNNPPATEAYNLYLQSKHLIRLNTKESFLKAENLIKQSISIDSSYAKSWDLLAYIYGTGSYNYNIWNANEGNAKALIAVKKAIQLDSNYAEAYVTLASLQNRMWEFDDSIKNLNKALELEPNNSVIIGTAALMTFGDLEKSVSLLKTAIAADPLLYTNYFNLGFAYYRLNRLEEAMEAFNTFSTYYPNTQILHYMKAQVALGQGNTAKALTEIEQETHEFFNLYGKNFVLYALGGIEKSEDVFRQFIERYSESNPANMADIYAYRGNFNTAFEYLEKAFYIKDQDLTEVLSYPSFKPMYSDPRWATFINKLGLPKDHGYHLN
ncbi:tetratricopeptide repeat protein [Geojedonia litorea]|uniref:Tetratricopeptide repeat protein n=1 Tax=Geojedonia litorea TaxID=1268269 RepID=A0ABV9N067_9FLAO